MSQARQTGRSEEFLLYCVPRTRYIAPHFADAPCRRSPPTLCKQVTCSLSRCSRTEATPRGSCAHARPSARVDRQRTNVPIVVHGPFLAPPVTKVRVYLMYGKIPSGTRACVPAWALLPRTLSCSSEGARAGARVCGFARWKPLTCRELPRLASLWPARLGLHLLVAHLHLLLLLLPLTALE